MSVSLEPNILQQPEQQYNGEAEDNLVGGLLAAPEYYRDVKHIVKDSDLFVPSNQLIYRAIEALNESGQLADLSSVRAYMRGQGKLGSGFGQVPSKELGRLYSGADNVGAIPKHATCVRDWSERRHIREYAYELLKVANKLDAPIRKIHDYARTKLDAIYNNYANQGQGRVGYLSWERLLDMGEILSSQTRDNILAARAAGLANPKPRLVVGLDALDKPNDIQYKINFLRRRLVSVVGDSSVGKTSFLLMVAMANAIIGNRVLYLFNELDEMEMRWRIESKMADLPIAKIIDHNYADYTFSRVEESRLKRARDAWAAWPGMIDFHSITERTTPEIRRLVSDLNAERLEQDRRLLEQSQMPLEYARGYDLVIVDYLNLIPQARDTNDDYSKTDFINLGNLTQAPDLDLSCIVAVQIKKDEASKDEQGRPLFIEPTLNNFMGSKFIHARSNIMLGIWREPYDDTGKGYNKGRVTVFKASLGQGRFSVECEYQGNRFEWRDVQALHNPSPNSDTGVDTNDDDIDDEQAPLSVA